MTSCLSLLKVIYLGSLFSFVSSFTIDISENANRDVTSLYPWAANCGVQTADCFELTSQDGLDVYAITNQNLPADNPILCVPSNLIMTGTKSWQELTANDPTIQRAEQTLSPSDHVSFYLFLKILKEYELGEQSPWFPWLNSLPRYFSNGASMTDFCFGCLPPYAAQQALAEKSRLKRFELALNEISSNTLQLETKSNTDLTKWAYNVVHTRYQELPGDDYGLIPMADYFNHGGAEIDAYISYDDEGNCYVYSTQNIPAGQPLRICYGDSTNPSQLLARYGFLDESSPATFCKYLIDQPSSEVYQLGYPSKMLFYNDGSISNEVWDVILYEELGKVSPQEQQNFYKAHFSEEEAIKKDYHEKYLVQTSSALQNHISRIINELDAASILNDLEELEDEQVNRRLPLLMSHNEFVKNTFELVEQNLNQLFS